MRPVQRCFRRSISTTRTRQSSFWASRSRRRAGFGNGLASGTIYRQLWVTLIETLLAFVIGPVSGVLVGIWLALAPTASAVFDRYIKAVNAMPRVILTPVFFVWFGLGIASKVALGVTLVFFVVFFNVYQGVREVSPVVGYWRAPKCWGHRRAGCFVSSICRRRLAGRSPACTTRSGWRSWAQWSANTWDRPRRSATLFSRQRECSTSIPW